MKTLIASAALLISGIALSHTTNPFSLATRAYQGAYSEVELSDGSRLGGFATFCKNVRSDRSDVAEALYDEAANRGLLDGVDEESFVKTLEGQLRVACNRK